MSLLNFSPTFTQRSYIFPWYYLKNKQCWYIIDSINRSCSVSQQKLFRISTSFPDGCLSSLYFRSSFSSLTEELLSKADWIALLNFRTWTSFLSSIKLFIFRDMKIISVPIAKTISNNLILCYCEKKILLSDFITQNIYILFVN